MHLLTVFGVCALAASPLLTMEEALPAYSRAYDTAFRSLGRLDLSDAQTRITRLGPAGKPFQADLDALRRRQGEVSDLLVKAVGLKKQALAEKKAAGVGEGTKVLADAEVKAQQAIADLKRLHDRLTAAGARPLEPAPARDPNARD